MDYNQLKLLYDQIYAISLEIANLIEEKIFDELPQTVSKRDKILELLSEIRKENPNTQDYPEEIQDLIKTLEAQEIKNIERLEAIKEALRKELEQTSKSSKLVSAYSQDTTEPSRVNILE